MLSAEDREIRRGRVTSSTAAAILGLSPFATPLQAWEEITGRAPQEEPDEQTAAMFERGHVLEPALLDWACLRLRRERKIDRLAVAHRATRVVNDWAADSVDGILFEDTDDGEDIAALEAKTVSYGQTSGWGEPDTDQVPDHVSLQARWHLWAHDLPVCYLPILIGSGLELRMYIVQRQREIECALVETCERWWHEHVKGDRPPSAQAGDEGVLRRLFPRHKLAELPDDPAVAMLVQADARLRATLKVAEAERDAVRCELMERLGEHEGCRGDWGSVTWKASADRTSVDWKALVEALAPDPEIIERHTRVRPGARVLRTTWRDE